MPDRMTELRKSVGYVLAISSSATLSTDRYVLYHPQETLPLFHFIIMLSTLSFKGVSIALWEMKYLSMYPFPS